MPIKNPAGPFQRGWDSRISGNLSKLLLLLSLFSQLYATP